MRLCSQQSETEKGGGDEGDGEADSDGEGQACHMTWGLHIVVYQATIYSQFPQHYPEPLIIQFTCFPIRADAKGHKGWNHAVGMWACS
jgi:hypothetical protein